MSGGQTVHRAGATDGPPALLIEAIERLEAQAEMDAATIARLRADIMVARFAIQALSDALSAHIPPEGRW